MRNAAIACLLISSGSAMGQNGIVASGPWHPECITGVSGDGTLTPADFTAWLANFNAGC